MKRPSRKHKLLVGAFIVVSLLALTAAVLFVGEGLTFLKGRVSYQARFDSTDGLHVGAPVKMGGVEVGSVTEIALASENGTQSILTTVSIYKPHNEMVKADSRIGVETQGMLGDKFLAISPGSPSEPALPEMSHIEPAEKTSLQSVVSKGTEILDSVTIATKKIGDFSGTLPDAEAMAAMTKDFAQSAAALSSLMQSLNAKDSAIHRLSTDETGQRLDRILANLESASVHLNSVTAKIDNGDGTLGALVNDMALYDDVKTLLGRANRSKAVRFVIQQALGPEGSPEPAPEAAAPKSTPPTPVPKAAPSKTPVPAAVPTSH